MAASVLNVTTIVPDEREVATEIRRWIHGHLPATFPKSSIFYENQTVKVPALDLSDLEASSWFVVSIDHGSSDYPDMAATYKRLVRMFGVVTIRCCTPKGVGVDQVELMLSGAASMFRYQRLGVAGLTFEAPHVRPVPQEEWFQRNCVIPYRLRAHLR